MHSSAASLPTGHERVRLHQATFGDEVPARCTPQERWTNRQGEDKRCQSYCAFGKQQSCPYWEQS